MVGELWVQILFTILFSAAGLHSLFRVADARTWTTRVAMLLHAAMAAAMVAMTWPWGLGLPVAPQVAVFALAAIWFVTRGLLTRTRLGGAGIVGHSVLVQGFHAVMMAAMCWMLVAMTFHGGSAGHAAHAEMPVMLALTGLAAVVGLLGGSAIVAADVVSRPVADGVSIRHRVDDVAAVGMALGMTLMSLPMLV